MSEPARPEHLRVRVIRGADRVTVVLSGDLDRLTGPVLLEVVDQVSGHPVGRIDIELAYVEFLDLGGVRALLAAHERAARDGIAVVVRNPQHYVRWLLDITGAAEVLLEGQPGPPALSWVDRHTDPEGADDRDRLADEREKMLDERQRRVAAHQQWEDIREELADQREIDLERRERED
jgi:anti-anti-sigma factor